MAIIQQNDDINAMEVEQMRSMREIVISQLDDEILPFLEIPYQQQERDKYKEIALRMCLREINDAWQSQGQQTAEAMVHSINKPMLVADVITNISDILGFII